jgi:hypothetical protein
MNKPTYKCIKSWTFVNSDGEVIEIFEQDKVKIVLDMEKVKYELDNNVVNLKIWELSSCKLKGDMIGYGRSLFLSPSQIINIIKI